jgi:hypothetical protein
MIEVVFADLLFSFKFWFEGFIVFLFLFLDSICVDIVFIAVVVDDIVVVRKDEC